MSSLFIFAYSSTRCPGWKAGHEPHKQNNRKNKSMKTDVTPTFPKNEATATAPSVASKENLCTTHNEIHGNIPTRQQPVDPFLQARILEGKVCSRHTLVIRSFEVGADGYASIETILNLLQDTGLNHSRMIGISSGGFGRTHAMITNNLIWVTARMQVQAYFYPTWNEAIEIDVWHGASGKHGIRTEWLLRSHSTGHVFARASCKWALMNQQSRRLSKMPDEVRAEMSQWLSEKRALQEDLTEKIEKLDQNAKHVYSGLKPRLSDVDLNQHVNNVKYARWMLEALPDRFLKNHQLSDITIEYKRECGISDVVQSLCEPHEGGILENGVQDQFNCNGHPLVSRMADGNPWQPSFNSVASSSYTHFLQTESVSKNEEIARGRTRWKRKNTGLSLGAKRRSGDFWT